MAEATTPMKTLREILPDKPVLVTLPGSATVLEAAERMTAERVGAILVVDGDGQPSGMFTERDLMTRVVVERRDVAQVTIGEVMTKELFTGSPDQPVDKVARQMRHRHIRHLPVIDDGRVLGLLSFRDLISAHLSDAKGEVESLTSYIQGTPDIEPTD